MNQILEIQNSQQQALLYLLAFLKEQDYHFTTITPLSHQRILERKRMKFISIEPFRISLAGI